MQDIVRGPTQGRCSECEGRAANERLKKPLTRQELRILGLVAEGNSNPKIASMIHSSPSTVKTHVGRIIAKLGVVTRTGAATKAFRLGILTSFLSYISSSGTMQILLSAT